MKLASKVALLVTMNVLADVLMDNQELKKQLMDEAGARVCACVSVKTVCFVGFVFAGVGGRAACLQCSLCWTMACCLGVDSP